MIDLMEKTMREKCPNIRVSEYKKIRTRKNSVFGHFSRSGVKFGGGSSNTKFTPKSEVFNYKILLSSLIHEIIKLVQKP